MNNDRKRIKFEDLVGVTVLAVEYTDEVITLFAEDAEYHLIAYGDCCALAYYEKPDGIDEFAGRKILKAEEKDYDSLYAFDGDSHDLYFYTLSTMSMDLDITLHLEHNGYYGGHIEVIKHWNEEA
jgi:tricorn protease-like protein